MPGIAAGILGIIVYLALYKSDVTLLFRWLGLLALPIVLPFMAASGWVYKKHQPDYASFRQLLRPIFVTFMLFLLLLTVFQYIMYNFVDTNLPEAYRQYNIAIFEAGMENNELSHTEATRMIADWQDADLRPTLMSSLRQFVGLMLPGFLLSALITLVLSFGRLTKPI